MDTQASHNPSQLPGPGPHLDGPSPNLLVVEDDPQISGLYKLLLERSGYQVSLAGDGLEALELYRAAHQAGHPYDLVMMDLDLPRMDGLECLRHLAQINDGIRVLVSSGSPAVEFQGLASWVAGVVHKPVRVATLLEQVNRALVLTRPLASA